VFVRHLREAEGITDAILKITTIYIDKRRKDENSEHKTSEKERRVVAAAASRASRRD
jgi:hypothetical protein